MRLVGLAVVLVLSVTVAPLAAEAQPTPAGLAMLLTGPPATATPEYAAFMKQLADLGWIAIVVLYQDLAAYPTGRMVNALTWSHWGLGLVGFVGMVGWLPATLSGLANSLTAFVKAISDWLTSKLAK